jgi:hypothetical protein
MKVHICRPVEHPESQERLDTLKEVTSSQSASDVYTEDEEYKSTVVGQSWIAMACTSRQIGLMYRGVT